MKLLLIRERKEKMKEIYRMTKEEILQHQHVSEKGLTESRVQEIRQKIGENQLQATKKKSPVRIFAEQFQDLLVIILMIAAVVSMLSGNVESTVVIFVVIVMNAVLGTVQYLKAEKSLDSLKALSSPHAKVLRDGKKMTIFSKEIVPGDILLLEAGDMIAADGRILDNYSLQVNESSLTGESTNVDKSEDAIEEEVALADRINMVYSGTLVAQGRAVVLVTATGMKTEMGKIAELMNATQERNTDTKQNDASVQMKKEIGDPTESCLLIMAQKAGLAKAGIRTVMITGDHKVTAEEKIGIFQKNDLAVAALPSPFKLVHLLFINLLTDSLPALAIGMEPSDSELLKQKPRNPEEGILTGKFVSHLFGYGALLQREHYYLLQCFFCRDCRYFLR